MSEESQEFDMQLRNERIREYVNEYDDGAFDTWKENCIDDLTRDFIAIKQEEFDTYCKAIWKVEQ